MRNPESGHFDKLCREFQALDQAIPDADEEARLATWLEYAVKVALVGGELALSQWEQLTLEATTSKLSDRLQPIRYLDYLRSVFIPELADWSKANLGDPSPLTIVNPSRIDLEPVVCQEFERYDLTRVPSEFSAIKRRFAEVEDRRTAYWDISRLADFRAMQMSRLGWDDQKVVWAHSTEYVTMKNAQFIWYNRDPRGGIIYEHGLKYASALTFRAFMLEMSGTFVDRGTTTDATLAVALTSTAPTAYYHELIDTFGSLAHIPETLYTADIVIPVHNRSLAPLYRAAGVQPERLRSYREVANTRFETVVAPVLSASSSSKLEFINEAGHQMRRALLPKSADRIYISRRQAGARRMTNEALVETIFQSYGFTVLRLEEMTIELQFAYLSRARVIAGAHGAGLANIVFADKGVLVIEILPAWYPSTAFFNLSYGRHNRHIPLVGKSDSPGVAIPGAWSTPTAELEFVLRELRLAREI